MSRQLTQNDETKLASAVSSVVAKQASGDSPTDALLKTAQELSLQPGEVRTVAHAVNTGMQLDQMENNKTATSRFASFPLCDPESVIDSLVNSHKSAFDRPERDNPLAAISSCRLTPASKAASVTKIAAVKVPAGPSSAIIPAGSAKQKKKMDVKTAHLASRMQLGSEIKKLAQLLTTYGSTDYILTLKQAAAAKHGEEAVAVIFRSACKEAGWAEDHIEKNCTTPSTTKLAAADHPVLKQFDVCMGACVKAADFAAELTRQTQVCSPTIKRSGFRPTLGKNGGAMDVALGNVLASSFYGPNVGRTGPVIAKKQEELDDPLQDQRLRNIRTQSMLSQLLTDPNDSLSNTHPLFASEAFNELASLAPRSSQQAAIVAPWLRRRLEGKVEPFEAKAVADTEKVLKGNAATGAGSFAGNQQDM